MMNDSSLAVGRGSELTLQIFDGLLTYSRVDDPTAAGGAGQPPQHLTIGKEGKADVKDGDKDKIVAELNGRVRYCLNTNSHPAVLSARCDTR